MPFAGLRVISFESRRAADMHSLILKEGGVPFVAPSVKEAAVDGAVQEYGRLNVSLYRWKLPDDLGPLREAVVKITTGDCDVVLFTSSVQLAHLLTVASAMGREGDVRQALRERLVVGSIGPVMNEALAAEGIKPDIVPRHPKMWALVKAAAEQSAAVMAAKPAA